jgi:pyridoxine 4-dehydrogenase
VAIFGCHDGPSLRCSRSTWTCASYAAVAARHGVTAAQVALAHALALSPSILLIPGTGTIAHLEENMAARTLTLTPGDLASLS